MPDRLLADSRVPRREHAPASLHAFARGSASAERAIYDGSFPGFLCACAEALNAPVPITVSAASAGLFDEARVVATDEARAAALWDRLTRRVGQGPMRTILEAYLSDRPGADAAAALALRRLREEGARALDDLSDPAVLEVAKASTRSRREAHLLCGLARLSELSDGSWYGAIEPACDVLILMADHFAARFGPLRFALQDARRGTALVHEPGQACELVASLELPPGGPPLSAAEHEARRLWKRYFQAVSIAERTNPSLQRGHMPKRYWSRLPETDEGERSSPNNERPPLDRLP